MGEDSTCIFLKLIRKLFSLKLMKKHYMKSKFLFQAIGLALTITMSCRQEIVQELQEEAPSIPVTLEQLSTKVNISDESGICTWTDGDVIGLFIQNTAGADDYVSLSVDLSTQTVTPSSPLTSTESIGGYAVYPYSMRGNGVAPTVNYLTSYSLSGRNLAVSTFSSNPMMAVGNSQVLNFYHVGALLRIIMTNVPSTTTQIRVTFVGMEDVTGEATVTAPGTVHACASISSGTGNSILFTDITWADQDLFLNIPLPIQDYSNLNTLRIEALDSSDGIVGATDKVISSSWGIVRRAWGRLIHVVF